LLFKQGFQPLDTKKPVLQNCGTGFFVGLVVFYT
jgi:hypothetical protein